MSALLIAAVLLGMGISLVLIPVVLRISAKTGWGCRQLDLHHTHKARIPRLGGLCFIAAFLLVEVFAIFASPQLTVPRSTRSIILLSSLAIFAIGFWDDLKPLGAKRKLLGQIIVSLFVWFCGIGIEQFRVPVTGYVVQFHSWGALVTVFWLVGMTNLINLIDGVDGLAGGISLMLMALLAFIGFNGGHFSLAAAGMAGALLGFLWYNFPPARIYMGDGGAYLLGFQIGIFALINSHKGTVVAALVAPLFVLALPIVDTALAILRRGSRGLPIFRPDRRHIHHHLLSMGLSRRRVVLSIYGVTLIFLLLGLLAFWSSGRLIPVLLGVAVLILLICAGNLSFSREWFAIGRVLGNNLEIRQEVQYGLSLTRWLSLEGGRAQSVEDLWTDLVFVVRKLGFCSVTLRLADGERSWGNVDASAVGLTAVHELLGGRLGVITLNAPCRELAVGPVVGNGHNGHSSRPGSASIADENLFDILSELVIEGWTKALLEYRRGDAEPLQFIAPAKNGSTHLHRRLSMPAQRLTPNEPVMDKQP